MPCFEGKNRPCVVDYIIVSIPRTFIEICPRIKHSKNQTTLQKDYAKSYKKNLTFYTKSYIIKTIQEGIAKALRYKTGTDEATAPGSRRPEPCISPAREAAALPAKQITAAIPGDMGKSKSPGTVIQTVPGQPEP